MPFTDEKYGFLQRRFFCLICIVVIPFGSVSSQTEGKTIS